MENNIYNKILKKKIKILIIGLGYVGLPLFRLFKKKQFDICGLDLNKNLVRFLTKHGENQLYSNYDDIDFKKINIIILALPTPLKKNKDPDLSFISNCIDRLFSRVQKNSLIILESTSYPGTTVQELVIPFKKKYNIGKNFFVGYSPEREDPGNKKYSIENITKIVSGYSPECLKLTEAVYNSICKHTIKSTTIETAEMAKIFENIFRAVNIALVNETNEIAEKLNIDFHEVLDLCKTKPFGFMEFRPGPGVGGHCIPVDPFYLSWLAKKKGLPTEFINLAGLINGNKPKIVSKKIKNIFKQNKIKNEDSIIVLGVSYKKNIADLRNSPAKIIFEILEKKFKNIEYFDPYVSQIKVNKKIYKSIKKFNFEITKYKAVILLTDHEDFKKIKFNIEKTLVVDCKNFFKNEKVFKL